MKHGQQQAAHVIAYWLHRTIVCLTNAAESRHAADEWIKMANERRKRFEKALHMQAYRPYERNPT